MLFRAESRRNDCFLLGYLVLEKLKLKNYTAFWTMLVWIIKFYPRTPLAKLLFDGLMYSKLKKKEKRKRGREGKKGEILLYANYERFPVYTYSAVSFNFKRNSKEKENWCLWNAGPIIHWEEGTRRLNLFEVSENQQHRSTLGSLQLWQGCCLQVTITVIDKEENRVTSVPAAVLPPEIQLSWHAAIIRCCDVIGTNTVSISRNNMHLCKWVEYEVDPCCLINTEIMTLMSGFYGQKSCLWAKGKSNKGLLFSRPLGRVEEMIIVQTFGWNVSD